MTTIIEIASIRPPKEGKKVATVVSDKGQSFEAFPEMASTLKTGARYEIELKERQWTPPSGGTTLTYRTITKAKELMPTDQRSVTRSKTTHDPRPQSSATAAADQEATFVARILGAAIVGGHVKLDARELAQATTLLRMLWSSQFGDGLNTFRTSEAQRARG